MYVNSNHKQIKQKKPKQSQIQNLSLPSTLLKLRSRIHKIFDEQFALLSQNIQKQEAIKKLSKQKTIVRNVIINESKLEEWVQMFRNEILISKENKVELNIREVIGDKQTKIKNMVKLNFQRPLIKNQNKQKQILWAIDTNNLNVFQFNLQQLQNSQVSPWKLTTYELPENIIKSFGSITHCPELNSLIIIGGSKANNQNIKSSKIYQIDLITSQISHISNLPYGLSSHTAIYNPKLFQIYIVGGNKNYCIVSRGCFKLKLKQNQVQELSCLNYPAANINCVIWRDRWIYKFGGVGEAFGQWDVSPYIQRYDILRNQWEVINPILYSQDHQTSNFSEMYLFHNESFLTNSFSYICQDDKNIFVFGGHSIDGKFKNQGFLLNLEINQNQNDCSDNNLDQYNIMHMVKEYGTLDCDEIVLNNFIFLEIQYNEVLMYGLQKRNINEEIRFPQLIHVFHQNQ